MKYDQVVEALLLERSNRFIASCLLDGKEVLAHLPNTGALTGLLCEGARVILRPAKNPRRKTKFTLVHIEKNGSWINVDSQAPKQMVAEFLLANPDIIGMDKEEVWQLKEEVTYRSSRFDLAYQSKDRMGFIEVKGVSLERDGHSLFPDGVTQRGTKHIYELIDAKDQGYDAGLFFCVQIPYAIDFAINRQVDPSFGEAYDLAKTKGVKIFAYKCCIEADELWISKKIDFE